MRRTPADIPGSALHPDGVVRGITAGGVPVSCDERWQAEQVEALLETRLRNQRLVDRIGTTGKCRNASQLRFNLTRICASAIPNHWMRNLPPSVTSAAAEFADTLISRSFLAMLRSDLSPDARVALVALAARLPIALGGFGLANYHATRHAAYTASFLATWPIIARAIPTLAAAHPPSSPFFAHLSTAYAHLQSTLATVRTRFAALDSVTYHDVFGDRQHAFHPPLKETLDMPDFNTLTLDTVSKITKSLRQKELTMVVNLACWIDVLDAANTFDASNAGASIRHREARRTISTSQTGSGLFLLTSPDLSLPATTIAHDKFLSAAQYRAGLYVSRLAPTLDERASRGLVVTQSDRLGDTAVNSANATARHNAVNRLARDAKGAALSVTVKLGDKGDGSTASRAAALRRYAHLCATHVPDIITVDEPYTLSDRPSATTH